MKFNQNIKKEVLDESPQTVDKSKNTDLPAVFLV